MVDLSRIKMTGPLGPFMEGFNTELQRSGYTYFSARSQLWLVSHLSGWMAEHDVELSALDDDRIDQYLTWRKSLGRTAFRSRKALAPLLGYLRGLDMVPRAPAPAQAVGPVEELLAHYRRYLLGERGVSVKTAVDYAEAVRPFVAGLADGTGVLRWESATAADVTAFILAQCRARRVRAAQMVVTATRSLLRWLHREGVIDSALAAAVPTIADRREDLPRGLTAGQVRALLDSCEDSAAGRRDYAMMLVMARLGLRAGEVAALRLDDVDWRGGLITVRGKPRRQDVLPLPVDVGEAIADYLRHARPATAADRQMFVRILAPHRGLTGCGVTQAVVAAGARSGLGSVTAHRLRHSAACAMLRAGSPLTEIGQVLRHERLATTARYAKTDLDALRSLARPWPGGSA
jgi:site-specific recombinase XerD